SSIRESSSDYEASESSIEIQTSPEPRGLITKEPFKGPAGHPSHKSKRQECHPIGEAQIEDSRASTSSQRLARTFGTLIESPEAEITAIPVVRPYSFPTNNSGNIPVSVQELVHGSKAAGVGTSSKSLDRHNELLSSSEVHGPKKDSRPSEGLDTHVLQRACPKDKILVEKPNHSVSGPEEIVGPKEGQQPSGSSSSLHKQ
ncbi:hypothetical protein O181_066925, partial [Austropuccinia psidii MF-1]|nr:hypothetical protein [Austropuccinia psidii MF-1]